MQRSIPFLWGLIIILLILNLALLYALNLARLTAIEALGKIEAMADSLANEVIVYNVPVNQPIPLKTNVPFSRTLQIPISTTIPIDQVLTVPVQTLAGEIVLDVPVKTDFPINLVVPLDFNETIAVDTVIQLNTTVPITIEVAQTPLAGYLQKIKLDLARLRDRLSLQGARAATGESVVAPSTDVEEVASESIEERN